MYESSLDGIIYSYSNLEDEYNFNFWYNYYENNADSVELYCTRIGKDQDTIEKIKRSAVDTAQGFLYILNVARYGNTESSYFCTKPDVIKGVAFIKKNQTDELIPDEILMSVGVFTTKTASFYVMTGICTGYKYNGSKKNGLSCELSKYVASIINEPEFTDTGNEKITFITRPLAKMGELFNSGSAEELHIPYDDNLSLPPKDDASYDITKKRVIELGRIRQKTALEWLKKCRLCGPDDDFCQMEKCVGDMCFFYHFVLDIFSPRWGYTGKRIEAFLRGGNHKSKNRKRRRLKRLTRRRLKKKV